MTQVNARPPVSPFARTAIIGGVVVLAVIFFVYTAEILIPFIFGAILAYALEPIVSFLRRRTPVPRILLVILVFVGFLAIVVGAFVLLVPIAARQLAGLAGNLQDIATSLLTQARGLPTIQVLGFDFALSEAIQNVEIGYQEVAARIASAGVPLARGVFSGVSTVLFSLFLAFYFLADAPRIREYLGSLVPGPYADEGNQMLEDINGVFKAYLLGQVLLALIIGVLTTVILLILGVPNAVILGIVAGLLEVVPTIGPILAAVPAVAVALFQPSTIWPLEGVPFALIVAGAYILIQQLEGAVIVPYVMGRSVNLHPVVVIFGVLAGASLGGIVGIFLAAPIIASLRVLFRYGRGWLFPETAERRA